MSAEPSPANPIFGMLPFLIDMEKKLVRVDWAAERSSVLIVIKKRRIAGT
jgi:hypothetical protein